MSVARRAALAHELVDANDHTSELAGGNQTTGIGGRDLESKPSTVDLLQNSLGKYFCADGSRLEMIELHLHADCGGAGLEVARHSVLTGLFAEGDEPGRTEHCNGARTECHRGVAVGDHQSGIASESCVEFHGRNANAVPPGADTLYETVMFLIESYPVPGDRR